VVSLTSGAFRSISSRIGRDLLPALSNSQQHITQSHAARATHVRARRQQTAQYPERKLEAIDVQQLRVTLERCPCSSGAPRPSPAGFLLVRDSMHELRGTFKFGGINSLQPSYVHHLQHSNGNPEADTFILEQRQFLPHLCVAF
jgi:hypothetical protein